MAHIGDALRQAFMPRHDYNDGPNHLHRSLLTLALLLITLSASVSTYISLTIVFPSDTSTRPFCLSRLQSLPLNATVAAAADRGSDLFPGAFFLTDQETIDYFWMVVFVPSALVFAVSSAYLVAGITVAYTAPTRHWCLKVVENNYCASRRGGVRCLAILNLIFAIIFGLLALFLGSTLLTLGSSCSYPLFWCYEITSWGLVILYGGTAFFLRRKAATVLDESDFAGRNLGLEMLEANPINVTLDMEQRVNEGFKSWMGSSFLSSDEDDDDADDYEEVPHPSRTNSNRQRV